MHRTYNGINVLLAGRAVQDADEARWSPVPSHIEKRPRTARALGDAGKPLAAAVRSWYRCKRTPYSCAYLTISLDEAVATRVVGLTANASDLEDGTRQLYKDLIG